MPEGLNAELGQADERVAELPCREHDRYLLGEQAACHECQGPGRRAIEPLGVVSQAQEWLLLGGLGQQAQGRQPDQELIWCRPRNRLPNTIPSASRWGSGRRSISP